MKSQKSGFRRVISACIFSIDGLTTAVKDEAAFRQEVILYLLLLPVLFFLPLSLVFKGLLLLANTIVLIVELLNSAIEAVVDIVSPEYNTLAKKAKDMGSAAVFLANSLTLTLWIIALGTL